MIPPRFGLEFAVGGDDAVPALGGSWLVDFLICHGRLSRIRAVVCTVSRSNVEKSTIDQLINSCCVLTSDDDIPAVGQRGIGPQLILFLFSFFEHLYIY